MYLREPILKNSRITLRLNWNPNPDFYLQQNATDSKKYRVEISEAILHATVFTPSMELKRDLYPRISGKEKAEPVFYHYPEMVVVAESIYKVSSYQSQNFAKSGLSPTKIFIVFVKSQNFRGHRNYHPFDFRR